MQSLIKVWYTTTRNFGYIVLNEQLENAALVGKGSKEHQVGNCWTMSVDGELSNLGRTIIAYRGHITRVMNELEPYFSEQFASANGAFRKQVQGVVG